MNIDETDTILCNKIRTPDGTILESTSVHDYKTHKDTISGETYMVDGGMAYLRRNMCKTPHEDLSVYASDAHERIRENFSWGTYGKSGTEEFHRILLMDMTNAHIDAIIDTQPLSKPLAKVFDNELEYRTSNNIEVSD